jgi:hypothetical protein
VVATIFFRYQRVQEEISYHRGRPARMRRKAGR